MIKVMSKELAKDGTKLGIVLEEWQEQPNGEVALVPHIHSKHWLGLNISGPSQSNVAINNLRLCFCPGCKLAWMEELPDSLPTVVGR